MKSNGNQAEAEFKTTINVGCGIPGNTVELDITITPKTDESNWPMTINQNGKKIEPPCNICFSNCHGKKFESIQSLIIKTQFADGFENWKFYGEGVEFSEAEGNCQYKVQTDVSKKGREQKIIVDNVLETFDISDAITGPGAVTFPLNSQTIPQLLSYRYVVACTDPVDTIYISQDPSVGVDRGMG